MLTAPAMCSASVLLAGQDVDELGAVGNQPLHLAAMDLDWHGTLLLVFVAVSVAGATDVRSPTERSLVFPHLNAAACGAGGP